MSTPHARPRRQRGDINTGTAIVVTVLLVALLAWWMYWPETIPVFGKRPDSELGKPDARGARDPRDARAAGRADAKRTQPGANPALYKWQDEQGQWHVTDRAPKDRPYEKVVVNPDTNVMPAEIPELARDKDEERKPR